MAQCMGVVPAWLAWPVKVKLQAGLADDGLDDAERRYLRFQAPGLARCGTRDRRRLRRQGSGGQLRGVEAEVADRLGDADAVAIGARECLCIEFADEREAAEEGLAEAHALFFGEADDLDREGRGCACASSSTMATPRTTPRMPSKAPALGTVSRCEPMRRRGASGRETRQERRADCRRRRCDCHAGGLHPPRTGYGPVHGGVRKGGWFRRGPRCRRRARGSGR